MNQNWLVDTAVFFFSSWFWMRYETQPRMCWERERARVHPQYIIARRLKKLERESWFTAAFNVLRSPHSHISTTTLVIGCDYTHAHFEVVREDYLYVSPLCSYTPLICPLRQKTNMKTCPLSWPFCVSPLPLPVLLMCCSTLISFHFDYRAAVLITAP